MNAHTPSDIVTRRAPLSSWNPETGTVSAVIAAGAGVQRWDERGRYMEFLSPTPDPVDQVPLLDGHARFSIEDMIGTVDQVSAVGGETRARLTLSRSNRKALLARDELTNGARYGVSVGYRVLEWKETTDPKTAVRSKTATRWQLVEVSLVPIPADPGAGTRSESMSGITPPAAEPVVTTPPAAVQQTATRAAVNTEIRSIARVSNLDQAWIDQQIDAEATADQARAAAFEAMQSRTAPVSGIRSTVVPGGHDSTDPEFRARTIGEALFAGLNPSHQPSEAARAYMGLSPTDVARDCLRVRGISTTGLSKAAIVERSLNTTSDFPMIMGDTMGRVLRQSYEAAPSGILQVARQTTAPDFRKRQSLMLSGFSDLEKVNEHGEFKHGNFVESGESYKIDTFGKIFGITRQAIVNDNLGAFADATRRMGQSVARFRSDAIVKVVLSNPKMSDGKTLFHADHGNLAASGGEALQTALSDARKAMRTQKGLKGEFISVTPKFLIVGPELETVAEKVVASITPATIEDVNAFSNLLLIVEPRIEDDSWFLVADPAEIDGLEYAYLEGEPGPQITTQAGFEIDGVKFRIRMDFGAGFVDWRSWYKSPKSA
ncbi:Mu-like prophage major head subunit gpT family protein [Microvirga sp. HBU67558]|uniref:prohead protease/major capsid protein fusion protein n=1 Tax=Microvirga TaxID=186650 RepID=UPI001B36C511|nr:MULTISPECIES: prohead protease/major capsid protein fusion protein [unclassified Microvirga]MBQ0822105.1 Mu-like prophage major head subunit gpT family protein [Microvirga sp. HBU67558]